MRTKKYILLAITTLFFVSCSLANGESASALPTVASLPSSAPPEETPLPTFTLIPPISTVQVELTRAFNSPQAETTFEADMQNQLLDWKAFGTLSPSELEYAHQLGIERLEGLIKGSLALEIINREMKIEQRGVQNSLVIFPFRRGEFYIQYTYQSNDLNKDVYLSRLPYAVCALREAGFTSIAGSVHITLQARATVKASTNSCLNTSIITRLNCDDPGRIDPEMLLSPDGCTTIDK